MSVEDLIVEAESVQGAFELSKPKYAAAEVGSALRTANGTIYTGVSLHLACGVGFCAEHAAIAEMLKNREADIDAIVAVNESGVIPPCGRCRELMAQISTRNFNARIILSRQRTAPLRDLLPEHWLERQGR